jgi:hypothetical protein
MVLTGDHLMNVDNSSIMAAENTNGPVQQEPQEAEKPAWYDFLINIFKILLETSNFKYGIKKKF